MKTVLVTGVNGFVGNHLVKELKSNDFSVFGVGGNLGNNSSNLLDRYLELDLTNQSAALSIDFKNIDYVIHLAGLADVGNSFNDPMGYINTNIGI